MKKDHNECIKKEEELVKNLKKNLQLILWPLKTRWDCWLMTHNAYDMAYVELESTIKNLKNNNLVLLQVLSTTISKVSKSMNSPKETQDEIL